ncbi:P-loop containing nucleoside triphosphate hydrolase protein [Guyanagaster necrorhizus]|uniref:P-loop containing nucleoside triphosphate hydrolase protein n=1 Tax=Guyanagaster necrorhizus TaxID=856835 RepID=A0A9P7W419_9AGAR|nr:P-loop containing nucleoside triphosphate hydrolase protein [Guyanagaster necrorhizus MCA 3950]KAG7452169.1 P-loop containing nucleoside triphosphate hydrolase protein [Guyanagaster necrorhizus MCA 3950]
MAILLGGRVFGLRPAHSFQRYLSSATVINIPKADVYRFGDANAASTPVFRDLDWTVKEGESWAVVGFGSHEKHDFFHMLLGNLRISPHPPSPGGLFPFLFPRDPHVHVAVVSFGNRRRSSGGAFYDYTARYGAVQEEDRITLRQHMFPETLNFDVVPPELRDAPRESQVQVKLSAERQQLFDDLVERMGLKKFLDLPLIALSNGQTRRARILKAIWTQPELLLLDEPLTGLDVQNRPNLLNLLHSLHQSRSPRVILGLRIHDPVPDWITHVALLRGRKVVTGPKHIILTEKAYRSNHVTATTATQIVANETGAVVVDLKNVRVQYDHRVVLRDINWKIRQGERWHLQGENGSGKTTLLSIITGDHPQSYTQLASRSSHLHLFGRPRSRIPTPHLQSLIGVLSPEMFDAFPRKSRMSVWDVVGTGFDGTFVPRGKHNVGTGVMQELTEADVKWRVTRCEEVIAALGPGAWADENTGEDAAKFNDRAFVELSVGEQRMVLLMRALVGRPQLVLLDEVWSGMDEGMISAAKKYLREGGITKDQAVVIITHWQDEVPWGVQDGVKKIRLVKGQGIIL